MNEQLKPTSYLVDLNPLGRKARGRGVRVLFDHVAVDAERRVACTVF